MKDNELRPLLEKALEDYAAGVGTGVEGAMRDALTELKHIADKYKVDFQDRVDAAVEVAKEEDVELNAKEFEVELYELHSAKYKVHAVSMAEAIISAVQGNGERIDGTDEHVEMADGHGMKANDKGLNLTDEELAMVTKKLGIEAGDSIPSFRQIREA